MTHPYTRKSLLHSRMVMSMLRSSSVVRDGDSSSYKKVSTSQPYDDIQVEKLMCSEMVTHPHARKSPLHSRMAMFRLRSLSVLVRYRRKYKLRKRCQQHKGHKLSDNKGISGADRLTEQRIDTLQNDFGCAIGQNCGDLQSMQTC